MPEMFETFDADGAPTGLVRRDEVHRLGLWHRSAQVFLFDSQQRLVLHRRAAQKDLYANLWDHSIGEHLLPGESYAAGAQRGLREEFGLRGIELTPLGTERRQVHKDPHGGWHDREILRAFRGVWDEKTGGAIAADPREVQEVRSIPLDALGTWLRSRRELLTPWFEADLHFYQLLPP